jgi:SpoVK/Ycf46/Vps4 family AAA+-type ATPase
MGVLEFDLYRQHHPPPPHYPQATSALLTRAPSPLIGAVLHGPHGVGKSRLAVALGNGWPGDACAVDGVEVFQEADPFASIDTVFGRALTALGAGEAVTSSPRGARSSDTVDVCGGGGSSADGSAPPPTTGDATPPRPLLLVIDQFDALCPALLGGRSTSTVERQVASHTIRWLDRISEAAAKSSGSGCGGVFVVAVTADLTTVDRAARRSGRLGVSVRLPVPTPHRRRQVATALLKQMHVPANSALWTEALELLVRQTPGFVAADLEHVCQQVRACSILAAVPPSRQSSPTLP